MFARSLFIAAITALVLPSSAGAQDPAKLVTKADVEKATGAKFKDGWKPMAEEIQFQQEGGDLQLSVGVEKREGSASVRSWEATIKKMQPATKVETIKGVGRDAIFYSPRSDSGALSADFEKPRVQLRVAVAGAKNAAQAQQIVTDLAKVVGPRVGN